MLSLGRVKNTHGTLTGRGGTMDSTESYLWVSGPEWPVPPGRLTRIESRSSSTACLVFQGAVPAVLCLHCQLEFLIKLDSSGESVWGWEVLWGLQHPLLARGRRCTATLIHQVDQFFFPFHFSEVVNAAHKMV